MSFREKTAWISLVSTSVIYAIYFSSLIRSRPHGAVNTGDLMGAIITLVVLQTILNIAVAIFAPKDAKAPRDERDKLIDLRASRFAYAGLATGIAFACFFGALTPPIVFNTNALLFILVAAEIMRSGCQVIQYRRGA